ncbi:hypothetical protein FGO68_gene4668 [Halteria grandinella]|uniref:Uncharacterized protein n=1 Tax=Halteria grandinella TaxID=5974 RepID=A0A8J8SZ26_HALGN|nr:hypothetical protein FGO68_gene4668 [Halteria grandinella]
MYYVSNKIQIQMSVDKRFRTTEFYSPSSYDLKPGQSRQEFWINRIQTRKWDQPNIARSPNAGKTSPKQAGGSRQNSTQRTELNEALQKSILLLGNRGMSTTHQSSFNKLEMPALNKNRTILENDGLPQLQGKPPRQTRNQPDTYSTQQPRLIKTPERREISHKSQISGANLQDILEYLKKRVAVKQTKKIKRKSFILRGGQLVHADLYKTQPPKGQPIVHQTTSYTSQTTYFPNMDQQVVHGDFNKTQCHETRFLKHLKDTRVVEIMRPMNKFPMGNVPNR